MRRVKSSVMQPIKNRDFYLKPGPNQDLELVIKISQRACGLTCLYRCIKKINFSFKLIRPIQIMFVTTLITHVCRLPPPRVARVLLVFDTCPCVPRVSVCNTETHLSHVTCREKRVERKITIRRSESPAPVRPGSSNSLPRSGVTSSPAFNRSNNAKKGEFFF